MGPVLAERSTTLEMNGPGVNHTPSWNVKRRNARVFYADLQNAKPFQRQVSHWGKVITGYLLLLNQFCSFLIQTVRSLKLQLGDASFHAACYWMQRTVHCMGFVVEWFIGMQWAALGFGKRWSAWLCFFLCPSVAYCLLSWAPLLLCLPFHTPLCLLKFFQFLSLSVHLQFSFFLLCFKISLLPSLSF